MKRLLAMGVVLASSVVLALSSAPRSSSVLADDGGGNGGLQAVPSNFVGKAGDCGTGYPAGSHIVTSAWLPGLGLPDNGGMNDSSTANAPHSGLLLSKNGLTTDCSAAGASITGLRRNMTVPATFELGFDIRNGTHCGAGAPRFDVITSDNVDHFAGCADGTLTPAPQDPAQWTRVRFTPAQEFPPIVAGSTIKSIDIVFDEGTDTANAQDPMGVGLATIDNIDIGGKLITAGPSANRGGRGDVGDDNGHGHGHGGGD